MGTGRDSSSLSSSLSSLTLLPPPAKQRRVHRADVHHQQDVDQGAQGEDAIELHRKLPHKCLKDVDDSEKKSWNEVNMDGEERLRENDQDGEDDLVFLEDSDSTSIPTSVSLHRSLAERLQCCTSALPEQLIKSSQEELRPIYPLVLYRPPVNIFDHNQDEDELDLDKIEEDAKIDVDQATFDLDSSKMSQETMELD